MVLLQRSAANSLDVNNGYADWRLRSTLVDHENRAVIGMIPEKSEFHFVRRTTSLRYLDRIDSDIINATVTYNNYVQNRYPKQISCRRRYTRWRWYIRWRFPVDSPCRSRAQNKARCRSTTTSCKSTTLAFCNTSTHGSTTYRTYSFVPSKTKTPIYYGT
jgi:hypothetical protein